jgi:anhydro-N-acetylmuramic acid kinase
MKTLALGLMTGTSCDGVDAALIEVSHVPVEEKLLCVASKKFPAQLRAKLRAAQTGNLSTKELSRIEWQYSCWIADFCESFIKKNKLNRKNLLIGFHGQTVWHEPPVSIQLGIPAVLAAKTQARIISGFRQPDLAMGGQGAPLVPYYHWLRARSLKKFRTQIPFAIHNIGGIANVTVVTSAANMVTGFDTGPGNALIDMAVEKMTHGKKLFDSSGKIALSGLHLVPYEKIDALCRAGFFAKKPPKSTGRELFNEKYLEDFMKKLKVTGPAAVASATALTACSMAMSYSWIERDLRKKTGKSLNTIYLCGGGAHNDTLRLLFTKMLEHYVKKGIRVQIMPEEFARPEYIEAMAFARFAVEVWLGKSITLPSVTGAKAQSLLPSVTSGQIFK